MNDMNCIAFSARRYLRRKSCYPYCRSQLQCVSMCVIPLYFPMQIFFFFSTLPVMFDKPLQYKLNWFDLCENCFNLPAPIIDDQEARSPCRFIRLRVTLLIATSFSHFMPMPKHSFCTPQNIPVEVSA